MKWIALLLREKKLSDFSGVLDHERSLLAGMWCAILLCCFSAQASNNSRSWLEQSWDVPHLNVLQRSCRLAGATVRPGHRCPASRRDSPVLSGSLLSQVVETRQSCQALCCLRMTLTQVLFPNNERLPIQRFGLLVLSLLSIDFCQSDQ